MPRAYSISFKPSPSPIYEPVTKFGGQPVWVQAPAWPLSRSTGEQMKFVCQIALYPEIFGETQGKMAYLFITDLETGVFPTWDPDMGENAVVLQPGRPPIVQTKPLATGPTLYEYIEVPGQEYLQPRPCEFSIDVFKRTDPEFMNELHKQALNDREFDAYTAKCEGNKIGGTPYFLQEDRLPPSGHLLLQLDSTKVPFWINFGDSGVGYAFISPDGTLGKFLFQCY